MFYPKDKNHNGDEIVGKMVFVYGYVDVKGQKRWGWLPLESLKK